MSSIPSISRTGQIGLIEERRYLALNLPLWATDCLKRAEPALAASAAPLVLFEKQRGAMRIVALDDLAAAEGLIEGQSLADARALVPGLVAREMDRPFIEQVFADFADWHSYASPLVSVVRDVMPYGDLVLDITGVAHLFGGERALLERVLGRLQGLGFSVSAAVAGSIGAAWALAHFGDEAVIEGAEAHDVLAGLPVSALRLSEEQIAGLGRMGLKRIGQLYGRDRRGLIARFGETLILRLDQALGLAEERLVPRLPPVEHFSERRFAEPIGMIDDVLMTAADLAVRLSGQLEAEGLGAQSFHLFLYRVDHKLISLSVNAARATRDAGHIARLFSHRAERLGAEYDAGFGIDMIRLAASSLSPVPSRQVGVFEVSDGTADLDQLFDRMTSRLGPLAVVRSKFIDTHIPERAVMLEPVIARSADNPRAVPQTARRPIRLLPMPEPIQVLAEAPDGLPGDMTWRRVRYRFIRAAGPERIEGEWWRRAEKLDLLDPPRTQPPRLDSRGRSVPPPYDPALPAFDPDSMVRDYYIAEDDGGRRFWIFREGLYGREEPVRWFLHGIFA